MRHSFRLKEIAPARRERGYYRRLIVVLLLGFESTGCLYGLHPQTTLEGKPFSHEALSRVEPGASQGDVLRVVGEPLEIEEQEPNLVVWRYYERARLRGCRVEFLGFIPVGDSPIRTVEALVFLRSGTVEQVEWPEKE